MSTNWQQPQAAAPPPGPPGPPHNPGPPYGPGPASKQPTPRKRIAIIATLLVVIAGLAAAAGLVLVNGDDGDTAAEDAQYVVTDTATTQPVFEPAHAAGNDAFYPLATQLVDFQREVEEEIVEDLEEVIAEAEATGDTGSIEVASFDVEALEANVATGLYGGTAENTCDPERLISFLIENPKIGEAWARVQGIEFNQIPTYIRSLEVRVLAEPVAVLNHGYDAVSGAAYQIDSVLAAGTAVLVDENGDIRTRCYCGNPILPKPPVAPMPPRCIVFGAPVFVVPGGPDRRENAPRDVLLTGKEATLNGGAIWVEVKWGNGDDNKGWVTLGNLRNHYCPPPDVDIKCPGPGNVDVFDIATKSIVVGEVTGTLNTSAGNTDIFGIVDPVGFPGNETIEDDHLLIHFEQANPGHNSGWVKLADLTNDDCGGIDQCIDLDSHVRSRANGGVLDPTLTGIMTVRFTGHFVVDNAVFTQVRILDGSGRTGWIPRLLYTPLAPEDCVHDFDDCIAHASIFSESDNNVVVGAINDGKVRYDSPPVVDNDRVRIHALPDVGPTGWIEVDATTTPGVNDCRYPVCAQLTGQAYPDFPTDGAPIGPIVTPTPMETLGVHYNHTAAPAGVYQNISVGGSDYWVNAALFNVLPDEACDNDIEPECPQVPDPGLAGPNPGGLRPIGNPDDEVRPIDDMNSDDDDLVQECCVTALFNSTNAGDPANADEYPAMVTVVGQIDDGGEIWYITATGRFFRFVDIDFSGEACEAPECPSPVLLLSMRDELELIGDDTVIDVEPDRRPEGEPDTDCCVSALFVAPNVGAPLNTSPEFVTVAAGPELHPPGINWYETTDGEWFSRFDVVPAVACTEIVCPTDSGNPLDDILSELKGPEALLLAGPSDAERCCAEGDVFDMPDGAVVDTINPENYVTVIGFSEDGLWAEILWDGDTAWMPVDSFLVGKACQPDDDGGECPNPNFSGSPLTGECCVGIVGAGYELVLLTGDTRDGVDGTEYETTDGLWIPEGQFVEFSNCSRPASCPNGTLIETVDGQQTCCASIGGSAETVTLTGEHRPNEFGEVEFETVEYGWIVEQQFVNAGDCDTAPCPPGDEVIDGECVPPCSPGSSVDCGCSPPLELINGECVPPQTPCPNGQVVDANGNCFTPCPSGVIDAAGRCCDTGQVLNSNGQCADPCASGVIDAAGRCCDTGQVLNGNGQCTNPCASGTFDNLGRCCDEGEIVSNGQCADPCIFRGGDSDGDGVCEEDDNCPQTPNPGQVDSDQDGRGDVCDQRDPCFDLGGDTDGDGDCDEFDNCPQTPNPDQVDSDGDGRGDVCDQREPVDPCLDLGGDFDGDGICDQLDNCIPTSSVPQDTDKDGVPDICDICPNEPNPADSAGNQTYPFPGQSCFPTISGGLTLEPSVDVNQFPPVTFGPSTGTPTIN